MRQFLPLIISPLVAYGWAKPVLTRQQSQPTNLLSTPFSRVVNLQDGQTLLQQDLARVARYLDDNSVGVVTKRETTPIENIAVCYIAHVGVGTPPTYYDLIVDTGSSNTWVGATPGKPYVPTEKSFNTSVVVNVTYGEGTFQGWEVYDTVTLGDTLVIKNQSIGAATAAVDFQGVDGILGVGPTVLTTNTLRGKPHEEIPTVTDQLYAQGTIHERVIGISFEPYNANHTFNGEITWGGVNTEKTIGPILYVPVTDTKPAGNYWGINITVTYSNAPISGNLAGIVDTGTTLILLATDLYNCYVNKTGAVLDPITGLLTVTEDQYAALQPLVVTTDADGFPWVLTPNAQIWPRAYNSEVGGDKDKIYLIVGSLGFYSGTGFDFILGQSWLERFYSVYDSDQQRVGIAYTPHTLSDSN